MPYHCLNKHCNAFNRYKPAGGPCKVCGQALVERRPLPDDKKKGE